MSILETQRFVYTFPSVSRDTEGNSALAWTDGMQPFHMDLQVDTNSGFDRIHFLPGGITPEECRRIIDIGNALPNRGDEAAYHGQNHRECAIAWIMPGPDADWLFHRIAVLFDEVNAHCQFDLLGLTDPLQYTTYGPGQHFTWHRDIGNGSTCLRKLSMTVQLSESTDYEGGDLEFVELGNQAPQRGLGTVTIFPSFIAHRVTPVTAGRRRSLVAWASGPTFR